MLVLILLAGGGALRFWTARLQPLTVQVVPAAGPLPLQVFGLGTVGARVQSNVGFKVAGVLAALNADEGDHVPAGAVLARLDARDVEAQLAMAKAGVTQAEANLTKADADVASARASRVNAEAISGRRAVLVRSGVVSQEEAQTDAAAMRVARANVQVAASEVAVDSAALTAARAQQDFAAATLDNYTLRAPYDAWVVARNQELGSMPVPGQAVFTLVDPRTIWVLGYVDERLAGRLAVGQPAEIVLRSDPGRRLPGHVARIEVQSDAVNEERLVEVAFDQIPPDIHLAEQAEVVITTGTLAHAVAVPPAAVADRVGDAGKVWTLEDGKLRQRAVSFGPELLDGRLPITGGLPEAAQVVVAPPSGLTAGRAAHVGEPAR
ncbi:MAG TPA: efflux RND transporter periplasmic adaptor subunit [Acetobacteraceae bacterium]|nr:efflux RND transporter periplasmic adaptor subunit [Acetobacteraceae bacterium]